MAELNAALCLVTRARKYVLPSRVQSLTCALIFVIIVSHHIKRDRRWKASVMSHFLAELKAAFCLFTKWRKRNWITRTNETNPQESLSQSNAAPLCHSLYVIDILINHCVIHLSFIYSIWISYEKFHYHILINWGSISYFNIKTSYELLAICDGLNVAIQYLTVNDTVVGSMPTQRN